MVTEHAYRRAKERFGLSAKDTERYFRNARERGRSPEDYQGLEREYLHSKQYEGAHVRCHNSIIYVFGADWKGITLYSCPEWFGRRNPFRTGKTVFRTLSAYKRMYSPAYDLAAAV